MNRFTTVWLLIVLISLTNTWQACDIHDLRNRVETLETEAKR